MTKSKRNLESIRNVSNTLERQEDCWMRINLRQPDRYTGLPDEDTILELYRQGVGPLSIAVRLKTRARYIKNVLAKHYPEEHEHNAADWNLPEQFI